jgi:hypothetical protein
MRPHSGTTQLTEGEATTAPNLNVTTALSTLVPAGMQKLFKNSGLLSMIREEARSG